MWLVKVVHSNEHEGHQVYECKGCNTKLIVNFVEPPNSNSIKQLKCSRCGTVTALFGVERERPGHELLTFVCPKCQNIETAVWKIP
jgi:hypothetical protein